MPSPPNIVRFLEKAYRRVKRPDGKTLLKTRLDRLLLKAGVQLDNLRHRSFSYGRYSALFESEGFYARVRFSPSESQNVLYEVGFQGSTGDVASRHENDAVSALRQYFDGMDLSGRSSDDSASSSEEAPT